MATILGARDFDRGNTMLNAADHFRADVSAIEFHTGVYSLQIIASNTEGAWARWAMPGTPNNPSVSVWLKHNSSGYQNDATKVGFRLSDDSEIELRWDSAAHTYDAYVGGVKVADGTVEVSTNDWFLLEFYAVIDNAGSFGVKINGHQSIDYSGDTQPGAVTDTAYLYVETADIGVTASGFWIDDLVWGSGGYLGNLRCYHGTPNADTAQDDWTPSAGNNYETVDETPENDADYNETNTNAHADELALSDFDGSDKVPVAVVAWVRARMEAATGDSIKVGIVSNAVEVTTTHALSTAYEYYTHTADEDPNGPIAWTDAAVDALLLRYEAMIS